MGLQIKQPENIFPCVPIFYYIKMNYKILPNISKRQTWTLSLTHQLFSHTRTTFAFIDTLILLSSILAFCYKIFLEYTGWKKGTGANEDKPIYILSSVLKVKLQVLFLSPKWDYWIALTEDKACIREQMNAHNNKHFQWPSVRGVMIFSGTTHFIFYHVAWLTKTITQV